MVSLRVASLFSGIGGLDLGLQQAGHRVIFMCEKDPHCKQVLSHRFPGVALLNDVAEVLPSMLNDVDIITAGFPCNDCSCENLARPGLESGTATRAVAHVFRLLDSRRVPWVLLENVVGLVKWHTEQRPAIDYVVSELENLGYRWAHRVVDLLSFGVPHKRRRVFIVASLHGDPRDVLLSANPQCQGECVQIGARSECYECFITPPRTVSKVFAAAIDLGEKRRAPVCDYMHCFTTSNGRRTCVAIKKGKNIELNMLAIEDAERLMGFPVGYTEPCYPLTRPNERRPVFDHDLQTFHRFSLLGLACAVPQSRWLGEQLKTPYNVKFCYDALSTPFEKDCPGPATSDRGSKAWPLAAYNMLNTNSNEKWEGRMRAPTDVSEFPVIRGYTPLGDFLEFTKNSPVRYELRAGYLRRLEIAHENIDETVLQALDVKRVDGEIVSALASPTKKPKYDILEGADEESEQDDDDSDDEGEPDDAMEDAEADDETEESKEKRRRDMENEHDLDEHGMTTHGTCVWIDWKVAVRGKRMFWPGVALHPLRDHAVIPESARGNAFSSKMNDDYRLVMFFDDKRSFAWVKETDTFPFDKYYGEAMKQPVFSSKTKFSMAVDRARNWCNARNMERPDNPIVARNNAILFDDPTPCGTCDVCIAEAAQRDLEAKPQTRRNRSMVAEMNAEVERKRSSKCPQMRVIELARAGQVGAVLALRKERAVGQRLVVLWQRDNAFYAGAISDWSAHTYSFRVDYDDGDVDTDFRPWAESISLTLKQDVPKPADAELARELKRQHEKRALESRERANEAEAAVDESPLDGKTMRRDVNGAVVQIQKFQN